MIPTDSSTPASSWPARAFFRTARLLSILGVVVGVLLFLLLPRKYTSESAVVAAPESRSAPAGALASIGAAFGMGTQEGITNPILIQDLLRSEPVLTALVQTPLPTAEGTTQPMVPLFQILTGHDVATPELLARARGKMESALATSVDVRTGIVRIAVQLRTPVVARAANNALIDEADKAYRTMRRTQALHRREFVETRLELARTALAQAEDSERAFLQRNMSRESPALQIEMRRLQRMVDARQEAYVALSRDLEMALQEEAKDVPALSRFAEASLPWQKSFPSGLRMVLAGFGSGILLALLLTFLAVLAQRGASPSALRTPGDLARALFAQLRAWRSAD